MSDSKNTSEVDTTRIRRRQTFAQVAWLAVCLWGTLGYLFEWSLAPPMELVEFLIYVALVVWGVAYLRDNLAEAVYDAISDAFENMELLNQLEENEMRLAEELLETPPEGHA